MFVDPGVTKYFSTNERMKIFVMQYISNKAQIIQFPHLFVFGKVPA